MSFNWNVVQLNYQVSDGALDNVVTQVHWTASKQDEELVGSSYGCETVSSPDPDSFTSYDQLTEEECLGWLFDKPVNEGEQTWKESVEAGIDLQIEQQKNPVSGAGTPWSEV
jgi:hypothetical protein